MSTIARETIEQITIDALERTAFVLAEPAEADGAAPLAKHARVRFTGPTSGFVVVSASSGFLNELAASMLGVEAAAIAIDTDGLDAIGELTNILGGSVLHEIGGRASKYSFGLPELLAAEPEAHPDATTCWFDCDGESLRVTCWMVPTEQQVA